MIWLVGKRAEERARLGGEDTGVVVNVARLDEDALGELGDLEVEARHNAVESLDEGHRGAEGGVHIGELKADVPEQEEEQKRISGCPPDGKLVGGTAR